MSGLISFAVWGIVFVGLSDNLLYPVLMKGDENTSVPNTVVIGVWRVGIFGTIGFIAGPVVLSLLFALFDIYPLITKK